MKSTEIAAIQVKEEASVKDALRQMDQTGLKILFVTDSGGKLLGTITDGDFRKWILAGRSLDEDISCVFNPSPVKFREDYDIEEVKRVLVKERFEAIPIVGQSGGITDVLFWEDVFGDKYRKAEGRLGVPVVIMAGGMGTRFSTVTKILPKPLIPVGEKPALEVIMDRFNSAGAKHFYITLNYKGEMIKTYFENISKDYKIDYVWEKEFLGTAGSLKLMSGSLDSVFMVSNCDIMVDVDYADLLNFHKENKNILTVVGSLQHHKIPYGVIHFKEAGKIKEIQEKPEFDFMVNTGVYILSPQAIDFIPEKKYFDMTDLIRSLLDKKESVGVYPVSEKSYVDIGELEEYKRVVGEMELSR